MCASARRSRMTFETALAAHRQRRTTECALRLRQQATRVADDLRVLLFRGAGICICPSLPVRVARANRLVDRRTIVGAGAVAHDAALVRARHAGIRIGDEHAFLARTDRLISKRTFARVDDGLPLGPRRIACRFGHGKKRRDHDQKRSSLAAHSLRLAPNTRLVCTATGFPRCPRGIIQRIVNLFRRYIGTYSTRFF